MNFIQKIVPSTDWIKSYSKAWFKADLIAGLTLGVILIPQGMAYAMIAGLPPVYGLYTALFPSAIYAFFGTSRHIHVGTVALDSLFVASVVSLQAQEGTENFVLIALLLTFMVGVIQFAFGLLRLGFLVNFLARPVIIGFTSAAAIIIALNQVKHMTGANMLRGASLQELFSNILTGFDSVHLITILIGLVLIGISLLWKKIYPKFPSALILVFISLISAYFIGFESYGIELVGDIPSGLPEFTFHNFDIDLIIKLLPFAAALALLGFMEAISIGKVIEERHDYYRIRPNQESIALGLVNIISSFFSAYVSTASFSRSAINDQSGGKTPIVGIVSAFVVLSTILFLTPLFYYLPRVVLGVIIFLSVLRLIDLKAPKSLWKSTKKDFIMYAFTLLATLFIGIQAGLAVGIGISLLVLLYTISAPHMAVMGEVVGKKGVFRNVNRFEKLNIVPKVLIVRFDARLFYANIDYFRDKIAEQEHQRNGQVEYVVIDCSGINSVDATALHALRRLHLSYKKRGIKLIFVSLKGPVRDLFKSEGVYRQFGKEAFFINIGEALEFINNPNYERTNEIAFQSDV
ncbi:MAG: sulfate permease [Crocinitomicaceae bacterium]|nr:sulfate permease [Crocinitomicaceae bacterium]